MLGGASLPTHWTLEEPLCEQDCSPGWWDCLGQVTWAIPWSPGSLPLCPRVPVTALKPLQAPVLLSQFQSRPLLHGKVGSMPASLLGQKTPTGLPQGHWDPGIPPPSHLHSIIPIPHSSPGCILRAVSSQGLRRCLLFQLLPLKWSICPSLSPHWEVLKSSTSASDTAYLFISSPLVPTLEAANQSPRSEKSCSCRTTPRSFQTRIWMAPLKLKSQTLFTYSVVSP